MELEVSVSEEDESESLVGGGKNTPFRFGSGSLISDRRSSSRTISQGSADQSGSSAISSCGRARFGGVTGGNVVGAFLLV